LAAARAASSALSLASLQALILTVPELRFGGRPAPIASGSLVEGTLPGAKCGRISSCQITKIP
jgi:hypothetical protein